MTIDFKDVNSFFFGNEEVSKFYLNSTLVWEKSGGGDTDIDSTDEYKSQYLTIESLEDGNVIQWKMASYRSSSVKTIYYSTDGSTWNSAGSTSAGATLATLNTGDKLYLKGTNATYTDVQTSSFGATFYTSFLVISKTCNVYGNIMSLIYGDNFENQTAITKSHTFRNLFNSTPVVSARNLVLPAESLQTTCYNSTFGNCKSLVDAPYKIGTANTTGASGATNICSGMFQGCTSLINPPKLPATHLVQGNYMQMFYGCTSLTKLAEMPSNLTLGVQCFMSMYNGCTSLVDATNYLPYTTLTTQCYILMFSGCTSLTKPPILPATTLTTQCYQQMFNGCTALTKAPDLPAETLASNCYLMMFNGCSNLNYVKALFTTTPSTSYTNNWLNGVASTGTFVKNPNATWDVSGAVGVPTGWTVITD